MPTVGTTSKPAYVYDAGTDTWVPVGVGAHTHDTSALVPYTNYFVAGKNKIINGDFLINQRNFTSGTANGYGIDRWLQIRQNGTVTYSVQTFTVGSAPVAGYEGKFYARQVVSGHTNPTSDYATLSQRIESVRTLAGQTVTISFWARSGSGTPKVAVGFRQYMGTGGSPSADVDTYISQVTLSTSWTRYSVTGTLPSISGKTIGTNNDDALWFYLYTSAGTDYNAPTGSLGSQNNTFDFWGVQVEAGSTATPFTTATGTLQGELAACQRYYFRFNADNDQLLINSGFANSTTAASGRIQFPVPMRTIPTSLDSANLKFGNYAGSGYAMTSVGFNQTSNIGAQVYGTVSGVTAGHAGAILGNSNGAYVGFNAEL